MLLIQEYEDRYGVPPSPVDWNPTQARRRGRNDLVERFTRDGCWPHANTVIRTFGSWSQALAAAGFAGAARTLERGRQRWLADGFVTSFDIAQMIGLGRYAIYRHLRRAGLEPARIVGRTALYRREDAERFAAAFRGGHETPGVARPVT